MWHFCNNHDQWRMAAMDQSNGEDLFKTCLGWLQFWPGIPLHYAGDEQGFATFGTALDGWAREELALSYAWRGMNGVLPTKCAPRFHLCVRVIMQVSASFMGNVLVVEKIF